MLDVMRNNPQTQEISLFMFLKIRNAISKTGIRLHSLNPYIGERRPELLNKHPDEYAVILACLLELVPQDSPKVLKMWVFGRDDGLQNLSDPEIFHAGLRYQRLFTLHLAFMNLWSRLIYERKGMIAADGFTHQVQSTDVIRVGAELRGEKEKLIISVIPVSNELFDGLNLRQFRKCERCADVFYASKDDERIKFCGDSCQNAYRAKRWREANHESYNRQRRKKYRARNG